MNAVRHDYITGDCREVLKSIKAESADLIVADPPYRIKSWEGFGKNHDKTYGVVPPEYAEWLPECFRVLKPSGSVVVFETPFNILPLSEAVRDVGFVLQPPLCWFVSFRLSHPRKGWYNNHWEPIVWGTKTDKWYFDNKPLRGGGSRWGGDVFEAASVSKAKVPGQKPIKLIERLIAVHVPDGGLVLDPFGGSGTTSKAASNIGRNSLTIEINPDYYGYWGER